MQTYRELLGVPEFSALFTASSAQTAATTVTGLALATLVYSATGSPLLSALVMFGPSLAQLAGASLLLSAADRIPPRAALACLSLVFAAGTFAQALPGIGIGAIFGISFGLGVLSALGGGVQYGLLNEILPAGGYLLGRSVVNMSVGLMQIVGFATGGLLVTVASPRGTLLAGAALYAISAAVAYLGLSRRPARTSGRPSLTQTWRNNLLLLASGPRRYVYLALCVPNGLVAGCESLFVSYSPHHAGVLFVCTAAGMLAGDTLAGRFVPGRWRDRLGPWLRLLLAVPYLAFSAHPSLPLACAIGAVASVGYSATLMLQQRLMDLTPHDLSGQALGLQSSCMLAMQGAGAALAGAIATWTSPASGITIMAAISVAVTIALAPALTRRPGPIAAGKNPDSEAGQNTWAAT
ncbi:MAG: transporter [Actinomycetia bacterium]|nr:transporter [Actinomycetes bacterium]